MSTKGTADQIAERYLAVVEERDNLRAQVEAARTALADADAAGMALVKENERLQEQIAALRTYVRHAYDCSVKRIAHCSCGLGVILARVAPANSQAVAILIEDECDADD